jgi:hypothetical protein
MSKFTIIIRGIAASYMKDDAWKVLFPFDNCHSVKLKVGDIGILGADGTNISTDPTGGIVLGQRGVSIDVSVTDPVTRTAEGDDYNDFLDLTGEGVHEALMPKSRMDKMDAVMLTMGNAEFSVLDHVAEPYRLVSEDITTESTTSYQKIGNCGVASIEGSELKVRVVGLEAGSFSMSFTEDVTIAFDNECYDQTAISSGDLEMLYAVIRDADEESRKFKMEVEEVAQPAMAGAGSSTVSVAGGVPVPEDPLMDPGPTGGLPCNKFRISKPGDLP